MLFVFVCQLGISHGATKLLHFQLNGGQTSDSRSTAGSVALNANMEHSWKILENTLKAVWKICLHKETKFKLFLAQCIYK